ncbi:MULTISPECIES: hypothetical protein [unclassified Rhodococcus (in: high G+C Gram-positive bacteria)]|uniref:hypothetical protein n=1 Tax=unclassified Rhodococcus (in: high G+C Gram-positive bacteria) TaxID=192944 RepID=UPI00163A96D9|nr:MULTISPECIES: hypothetical protein [unclassified Rhodococcus (in: high G+C Gram-positive bacteria)]MBC2639667.1 hypothetical protein [Rhodococcus sp. 3A]MBC2895588.1 hypothetical protein [Rhodococcus sp. 4CII]
MTDPTEPNDDQAAILTRERELIARLEVLALLEAHVEDRADDFRSLASAQQTTATGLFAEALGLLAAVLVHTGTYAKVVADTRARAIEASGRG